MTNKSAARRERVQPKIDPFGMKLPSGKQCSDCHFFSYCYQLFGCKAANTVCDWAPSRFQLALTKHVNEACAALKLAKRGGK